MLGLGSKKRDQAIQDEKAFTPGEPVRYGGFNGNNLLIAIVFTATVGFSLFGYDQGKLSRVLQILLVSDVQVSCLVSLVPRPSTTNSPLLDNPPPTMSTPVPFEVPSLPVTKSVVSLVLYAPTLSESDSVDER